MQDLEIARIQGQRWRTGPAPLNGPGEGSMRSFTVNLWKRSAALLLLKDSAWEIAAIRATTERTVRGAGALAVARRALRSARIVGVLPRTFWR
jgi:hypothetical protein